jgi:hypothetical protein
MNSQMCISFGFVFGLGSGGSLYNFLRFLGEETLELELEQTCLLMEIGWEGTLFSNSTFLTSTEKSPSSCSMIVCFLEFGLTDFERSKDSSISTI